MRYDMRLWSRAASLRQQFVSSQPMAGGGTQSHAAATDGSPGRLGLASPGQPPPGQQEGQQEAEHDGADGGWQQPKPKRRPRRPQLEEQQGSQLPPLPPPPPPPPSEEQKPTAAEEEKAILDGADLPACWGDLRAAVEVRVRPVLERYIQLRSARRHEAGGAVLGGEIHGKQNAPPGGGNSGSDGLHAASDSPRVDSFGCVTALAGAPEQHYHPDGTAVGLINAFVPLVSLTWENGPTELRPGSHVWRETALGSEPRWDEKRTATAAPTMSAEPGSAMLLFDYRCYHRGRANHSTAARPVAYVVFTTREGVVDAHNFPSDRSLVREAAARSAV